MTVFLTPVFAVGVVLFYQFAIQPSFLQPLVMPVYVIIFLTLVFFALYLLGRVPHAESIYRNLVRIGFVNHAGEAPWPIRTQTEKKNVTITAFWSKGFPIAQWEKMKAEIETALNCRIAKIIEGKDPRTVIVYTVPPTTALNQSVMWSDSYIHDDNDAIFSLGQGLLGEVTVDVDKMPHILIGGSTGSGKTVQLKVILWQAIKREANVIIADFKGGVDFGRGWHQLAEIVTEEKDLIITLDALATELERRKQLFTGYDVANIANYRKKMGNYLPRIVFACDEAAELFDTTGATKERRDLLGKIEARIALIARQGRAFGIHLVLATQRPDANVLPGQIKNNLDVRICGRADPILSTIILGDGRAAEEIPKSAQGRFLMGDGTVFQGYNFTY